MTFEEAVARLRELSRYSPENGYYVDDLYGDDVIAIIEVLRWIDEQNAKT